MVYRAIHDDIGCEEGVVRPFDPVFTAYWMILPRRARRSAPAAVVLAAAAASLWVEITHNRGQTPIYGHV
jgi:hypothetical protein